MEQAATIATDDRPALALIAAAVQRRDFDKALAAIDTLEKKQPGKPLVHNLRGTALLGKRDVGAARKSFERALALDSAYFPRRCESCEARPRRQEAGGGAEALRVGARKESEERRTVYVGAIDVNAEQVRGGYAWVFRRFAQNPALLALEAEAKAARRGLWRGPRAVAPWLWREREALRPAVAARDTERAVMP